MQTNMYAMVCFECLLLICFFKIKSVHTKYSCVLTTKHNWFPGSEIRYEFLHIPRLQKHAISLSFFFLKHFGDLKRYLNNDNGKTKQFCLYLLRCIYRFYYIEHNHRKTVLRKYWLIFVNHFINHFDYVKLY